MIKRRRSRENDPVEPDLPIVPMLDMSFQLLFFFVVTFNPTPAEGHLDMALPKIEGGESSTPPPTTLDEDTEELVVSVQANPAGEIAQIRIRGKEETDSKPLGADSTALFKDLQGRYEAIRKKGGKPSKVKLEMADNLAYKLVVKLMDEITRSGFKQVAPALLGADKPKK
jgi:biopolymer transport protein ExbD